MVESVGRALGAVGVCGFLLVSASRAEAEAGPRSGRAAELAELSLEELMRVEVYSAAKKKQKLSETASAVYVLTQEDIRRSGVTSVPEALRLVPGVEVARIDSNKWAITIRGFNERFANKLLVLVDGRSVYTPLFAGVYWDIQDVVLEDVERIEVVRGPGGALWGANAVNGVINILTKHAKDTQGLLLSGGAGTEEEGFGTARYGVEVAPDAYLRVFGKYFARDDFESTRPGNAGDDASDEWHLSHGGFRMDWDPGESDTLTLQGDLYEGEAGAFSTATAPPPVFATSGENHVNLGGGNVLGRWTHRSDGSEMQLQAYYDRTDRDAKPPTTNENRNTADVDFQHRFRLGGRHDVMWGLGYRVTWDDIGNSFATTFEPAKRTLHLFSAFMQDEIGFFDDSLRLTLGTKLEHNDFTGVEVQPNARLLWLPNEQHSLWGAVSRAVRTPSRAEDDVIANSAVLPAGLPGTVCETSPFACVFSFQGDAGFEPEELLAFELGYRVQLSADAGLDFAGFFNDYDNLRTAVADPAGPVVDPGPPSLLVIPIIVGNGMEGETWGFEVAGDWQPVSAWKLRTGYTFVEMDLSLRDGDEGDALALSADGSSPQNQVFVRSMLDLPHHFELDANFKWVDELKALDIGSYAGLDLRVGWRPLETLELSVVGHNLLEKSNQEFASSQFVSDEPTKVERGVYGKITWRY